MTPPATNGPTGNKKRAASKDTDAGDEGEETLAKKPKVTKKGTATLVKKRGAKARESLGSVGDEEDEAETPSKPKPKRKPAAKGRGKAAAATEEEPKPMKKWKAEALAAAGKLKEEDGADHGLVGEDVVNGNGAIAEEEDGRVEIEFAIEEAA